VRYGLGVGVGRWNRISGSTAGAVRHKTYGADVCDIQHMHTADLVAQLVRGRVCHTVLGTGKPLVLLYLYRYRMGCGCGFNC
jgi:hypothetical protein